MKLRQSSIGVIWEHEADARQPLRIYTVFDCKEPMSVSSIEVCTTAILNNDASCALIIHSGLKSRDAEEKIKESEKRIGKTGIINTLTLTRRDFDLMLMINRIKDEMRRGDRGKLEVERLDKEVSNLWSRFYEEAERIVKDFDEKGYFIPKYDLHEQDAIILLSLSLSSGNINNAYEEYIKFFFPIESRVPILDITRAKERIEEKRLVDEQWKIKLPTFLRSILEDLAEGKRRIIDISRKYILVDEVDLQKWLEFLSTLSIVRQSGEYWTLSSASDLDVEIESNVVEDPKDIDELDEYEGTLRHFLAQFHYDELKTKLEAIRDKFRENLHTTHPINSLDFIRNIAIYHAIYMKGRDQFSTVIGQARSKMQSSKSELTTAKGEINGDQKSITELNEEIDELVSWEIA